MAEYLPFNTEIPRVVDFEIVDDYTVRVQFNDDSEQTIDFEPILLGPVFGQLRNQALFNQVQLDKDFGTLVWPNGADIDPGVLHDWPEHKDAIVARRRQQFSAIET